MEIQSYGEPRELALNPVKTAHFSPNRSVVGPTRTASMNMTVVRMK
jgi:hypothetical protein